jgi:hypothetical protein
MTNNEQTAADREAAFRVTVPLDRPTIRAVITKLEVRRVVSDRPRGDISDMRPSVTQRKRITASPEAFPDSVAARIQELADVFPDAEHEVAGGLAIVTPPAPKASDRSA